MNISTIIFLRKLHVSYLYIYLYKQNDKAMKEKQITIYQMSEDSIDTIDQMTIDVVYVEGKETSSGNRLTPPEYSEDEIISIECNGVCVSDFIGTLFSDQELIEALTDLETNKSLLLAKELIES